MNPHPSNDALDHPLVRDYLERLRTEAERLPADQAHELYADISAHLREALGDHPTEPQVREQLERVGSPGLLVDEAGGEAPGPAGGRSRQLGIAAVTLLVVAEVAFFLPTLAVVLWVGGLALLAFPREWSGAQRLRGYLSLGTGLPVVFVVLGMTLVQGSASSCTGTPVRPDGTVAELPTTVCTETSGTPPWVAIVALVLVVAYLVWQVLTARLLLRSLAR